LNLITFRLSLYSLQQHLLSMLTVFASVFKPSSQLRLENLVVRQQLVVLRRSFPIRPLTESSDFG
jgi:hypothetical protein